MATIKIVRTEEEFLALKPKWDSLVAKNPALTVFQTFEWNYSAWTFFYKRVHPGFKLFVVTSEWANHDAKVILPFYLNDDGCLEFIGWGLADVCSEVCARHTDNWHVFYDHILDEIESCGEVRGLNLSLMEADSEIFRYWGVLSKDVRISRVGGYSLVSLSRTEDFGAALTYLSKKDRKQIKALMRKNASRRYERISRETMAFPRAQIVRLRDDMCASGKRYYHFFRDEAIDLMEDMYGKGLCELAVFKSEDGEFEYAGFRLLHNGHSNFSTALYKDKRDSTGNHVCYMADKLRMNDCVFDFGLGLYGYKLETFRPVVRHVFKLESRPKTLRNFMKEENALLKFYVKDWLGKVSPRAVRFVKMVLAFCRGDNRRK